MNSTRQIPLIFMYNHPNFTEYQKHLIND